MTIPIPAEDPRLVPNRAIVDPAAITGNVQAIAGTLESHTALMAIVKADGYGHGMLDTARAALAGGATWLGVAHPASALALHRAGFDVPILSWLWEPDTARDLLPDITAAGLDIGISSQHMLDHVIEAGRATGTRARVHLKIDTGMGRGGVRPDQIGRLGAAMHDHEHAHVVGAWTHLSSADDLTDPTTDQQMEIFDAAVAALAEEIGPVPLQHVANSAATLTRPDLHRDLVRVGIAMYGYSPVPTDLHLRPALTVTSKLSLVKRVPAGQTIGYGHRAVTAADTTLGLAPIGYADGLHRSASNKVSVLVRTAEGEQVAEQIGTISMDQIVLDLGANSPALPGDEVVIFGDAEHAPTAEDWARASDTIAYEVLTSVSGRVPREVRS